MKYILSLFTFLLISNAFAGHGIVLVLEAPLLLGPDMKAPISSFVRKGQKIYIHNKNFGLSPNAVQYDGGKLQARVNQGGDGTIFYQTTDSQGRAAWIEARFVKLIYNDEREFSQAISPFDYDPKDYRIYEPIPEKYPFYQMDRRRLYFTYGLGTGHKTSYAYTTDIKSENYSSRHGLNFYYMRKVDYDLLDRFYYGVNAHLYGENNSFTLVNGVNTTEFRGQLGVGPSITYDAYKRKNIHLTFTTALTVNYDRTFVKQDDGAGNSEERFFTTFSFSPKFGTILTFKDALPFASIVIGSEIQFNADNKVKATKDPVIDSFWNADKDYIHRPLGATFAFTIGILETN